MEFTFKNEKSTPSLGRNGIMKTVGLIVTADNEKIILSPINSKLVQGRCYISLPKSERRKLIRLLKKIR